MCKRTVILFIYNLILLLFYSCVLSDRTTDKGESFDTSLIETRIENYSTETNDVICETPYSVGSGDVRFDIYHKSIKIDLNADGHFEEIVFEAGKSRSFIYINDRKYEIDQYGLAQLFAISDIDKSDGILEIILTDSIKTYDNSDSDCSSFIFWWNGKDFIQMGTLTGIIFDDSAREQFDPSLYFDANGIIYIPTVSNEIEEVWYKGRYSPSGIDRILKEEPYITEPTNYIEKLIIREGYMCALLFDITEKYYDSKYNVIWDYASWPHINGREIDPEPKGVFSIITSGPETLEISKVYGNSWLKLRTIDGYEGWICVVNNKVRGYDKVMYIDVDDIFE